MRLVGHVVPRRCLLRNDALPSFNTSNVKDSEVIRLYIHISILRHALSTAMLC